MIRASTFGWMVTALSLVALAACTEGSSGGGETGGGGAGGGSGAGSSGEFPEAKWSVTLPAGERVFAAIDDQEMSVVGVSAPGHLRFLFVSDGSSTFDEDVGSVGCVARGASGETAAVIDSSLTFLGGDGATVWTAPASQPCQLAIGPDRVVLADASGVRLFNINGQAIGAPVAVAADTPSPAGYRRMLDAEDVIGYANPHLVGGLTLDGQKTFEWDLPDLEVNAIRVQGVDVVAAVSFSGDANLCGQTVSAPINNTRAALVAFSPDGQCSWTYTLLNQGAAPQSTVIRDLAIAGDTSLWAAGDFSGLLSWGGDQLDSTQGGSFLIELSLADISPLRATNKVAATAIDASPADHVLVVSGSDVSLLR